MVSLVKKLLLGATIVASALTFSFLPNKSQAQNLPKSQPLEQIVVPASTPQPPEVEWEKIFGGEDDDKAYSVRQTREGGYILGGNKDREGKMIKTDSSGQLEWEKSLNGKGINSLQLTNDGGFVIIGGASPPYLAKTNSEGDKEWEKNLIGTSAYSVQQTRDGGFIVAGKNTVYGSGIVLYSDPVLIKTDSEGNREWYKRESLSLNRYDEAREVQQTSDGGYILVGKSFLSEQRDYDVYLMKTNSSGELQWHQTFGGEYEDQGKSVQQTSDGGIIILGDKKSRKPDYWILPDIYLVKTDSEGNFEWEKTFVGDSNEWAHELQLTSDGGFIIAGESILDYENNDQLYILKTDSEGNKEWEKIFGGDGYDAARSIQQTHDGGFIVAGELQYEGFGGHDFYLVKLSLTEPPIEPQPIFNPPIVNPEKSKLVLITHGWNDQAEGWPTTMRDHIRARIPQEWDVISHDWSQDADTWDPFKAKTKAKEQGRKLGQDLSANYYEHVHLLGHSAGSWLINETAKKLRDTDSSTAIHLTFWDAFVPPFTQWQLAKKSFTDWAEQYYVIDDWPFTSQLLPYAHDVNLSQLDSGFFGDHHFPHVWYRDTVTSPATTIGADQYGFIRSLEGGGQQEWEKSLELPRGDGAVVIRDSHGESTLENVVKISPQAQVFSNGNGLILQNSQTPLRITTDSPTTQTLSSIWFESELDIPENSNVTKLAYQFQGTTPSYASVYLNNNLLLFADQRVHGQEQETTQDIYIGDFLKPQNILGVRLTPNYETTTGTTKVFISNPEFGKLSESTSARNWNVYE